MQHCDRNPFLKRIGAAVLLCFVFATACFYTACARTSGGPDEVSDVPVEVGAATLAVTPVFVKPPRFLTDVCLTRSGDIWVTAEAGGVFRLHDPEKDKEWEDMRALPGFPKTDHCTAVCEDPQGRIWVGTASMGVQVFSGGKWQRYDRDTVLSGSHVHDLASSESGLTAVAHEYGVSVYDPQDDIWRDYTALNGLPPGGVRGVCFGSGDYLHCAMESGGYVRLDLRSRRRSWRLNAPDAWGKDRAVLYPLTETGEGLSSNFCNGVSVDDSGRICIAGLNGISYGMDRSFRYLQGRDLGEKIEGAARKELIGGDLKALRKSGSGGRVIYDGEDEEEEGDEEDFEDEEEIIVYGNGALPVSGGLKESYVTCVYYGRNGLWIGHRTKGVELRSPDDPQNAVRGIEWQDPDNPQIIEIVYQLPEIRQPVRGFVELPDGRVFAATYGAGLVRLCREAVPGPSQPVSETAAANHPSYRTADPVSVLQDFQLYGRLPDARPDVWAQYLGEDWVTKGDWAGRYGARKQVLCAMNAPTSRPWDGGVSNEQITVTGTIGPHKFRSDSKRYWVDWERADDNRDVLLQMEYGHRTQSEWNDNGEEYPRTFEGPDLWLTLIMDPEAAWRLSLYFFNSNGRIGENVERDYLIEIYESSQQEGIEDCLKKKPLCTARVADFASGGVYKSFAMRFGRKVPMGGGVPCFRVRLVRYGSLNVILNGIFLDRLPEEQDMQVAEQGSYHAPRWYDCGTDKLDGTAREFFDSYSAAPETTYGLASLPLLRLAFYRYVREKLPDNPNLAERLRWDAAIWTDADRAEFDAAMKEYWEEIQEKYPERKSTGR